MRASRWLIGVLLLSTCWMTGCGNPVDSRAAKELHGQGANLALTVLPALVRKGDAVDPSNREAARLAAGLVEQGLVYTRLGDHVVSLDPGWKASRRALWKRTVRQCRSWIKTHPQSTPHTLFVEYLLGTRMVAAVHVIILDSNGRLAYGRALHTDDPLYVEMSPIGVGDCTNLVLSALRQDLGLDGLNK